MKCYSCGKNFDYEKYYGICPKCGCYNKKETAAEQHQQYHDQYDNGYRHMEYEQAEDVPAGEAAGSVYIQTEEQKERKTGGRGSTIFLLVSLAVFFLIFIGGTAFGMVYRERQAEQLQLKVMEAETDYQEHALGEEFLFQGMRLTVKDAWTVEEGRESNPYIPQGMKLAAVELYGVSDGEWADKNRLEGAYVSYGGSFYWQIPSYQTEEYGEYDLPIFESYALCMEDEAEGCLLFLVEADCQDFTLCLEERADEELVFLKTIHSIDIHLEEMDLGGQTDE